MRQLIRWAVSRGLGHLRGAGLLCLLLFFAVPSAMAQQQTSPAFNHAATGFLLEGAHLRQVPCESCHIQGIFRGTPRDCATCHRPGGRAPGKTAVHIPTNSACNTCHLSAAWTPTTFRHQPNQGVTAASCGTCHNGSSATGKPLTHVVTTSACDACHTTNAWIPAGYNHAQAVPGQCATCHNNSKAKGKPVGHIPTTASCDACHSVGVAFAPVSVGVAAMHNNMAGPAATGNCSTCHGGGFTAQNAQTKPATHIPTNDQCDTCHTSRTTWATSNFDHATSTINVAGICSSCHGAGVALGKPATHLPTSQQCDVCHTNFTAFKPATMNHVGTKGQCASCHNGSYTFANANAKSLGHIPTTAQCDTCHVNGFVTWSPAVMDHTGAAGKCSNCHSGRFLAQNAQSKPATHVATSAQCDTCHTSTTSWATKIINHDALSPPAAGRCSSCHNSVTALGKPTTHIPTTGQCDSCHNNYTAFKPAAMNHAGLAGQCTTCHNGAYAYANAQPKTPGHIPTTAQCDTCHISGFVTWRPATMNHTGLGGLCSACHSGTYLSMNAQTKTPTHITTTAQCDTCHKSTTTWATANFNHATASPAVAGRCSTCHNGVNALGRSVTHIPTSAQCDTCHLNFTAFAPATMNHAGNSPAVNNNCSTCHGGAYTFVNALAKPPTHVTTTAQCDTCHKTTTYLSWAEGVTYTHGPTAVGVCSTCHNGTVLNALPKNPTHIPTTAQCDNCHSNYIAFKPATMNHTGLAGQCSNCHNGSYTAVNALAKTSVPSHIPTSGQCDSCHLNFVAFSPAAMNHTGLTGQCSTCHSGAYTAQNAQFYTTPPHVHPAAQCDSCHKSTVSWATAVFNHSVASPAVTGRCSTCHNGTTALGKPSNHIPLTSFPAGNQQCDNCHIGFVAFAPAVMNHTNTTACTDCHSGGFTAVNAQIKPVTHIPTAGYPQCSSCHSTVAWKPTTYSHGSVAGTCATCHNGTNALGKPASHIPTNPANVSCDACHTNYVTFAPINVSMATMHANVDTTTCLNCHTGQYLAINAQVKSATHISTTADCKSCHNNANSFTSWVTSAAIDHTVLSPPASGRCATCHNNTTAVGKPSTHIPSTAQCDTCHTSFTAFRPAVMSHTGTTGPVAAGNCATCHGGAYKAVNALTKPANHIPTTSQCDSCHKAGYVAWLPSTMNHTGLAGQCTTCHSGAYVAQNAQVKTPTHIPTTAQCDSCHSSTTTWATGTFNHATATPAVTGRCSTCHNGTNALGKPTSHIPTTAQCDACHKNFTAFAPATMSHALTTGPTANGNCTTCHSGGYTAVNAQAKTATHIPTTSYPQCDSCHGTVAWKPTSFNHSGVSTACSSCHNGISAAGMPAGAHIPTAGAGECSACHRSGVSWLPLITPYSHTGVTGTTCTVCHTTPYSNIDVKPASHLPTTYPAGLTCDSCHKSFAAWLPTTYNHSGATTNCQVCHGGTYTNIAVKPSNHIPTTLPGMLGNECNICHTPGTSSFTTPYTMKHGSLTTCLACHDSTTAYLVGTATKINRSRHKGTNPASKDCSSAGCHKPLGTFGTPYTKWN